MNALFVFGLLIAGTRPSEARKRSPTVPPSAEIIVGGLVSHSIHLRCNLPLSSPANVQWYDEVYNEGVEPKLIYRSLITSKEDGQEISNMAIEGNHRNKENFRIGEDYSLTISGLNITEGPGKYFCQSTLDDGTMEKLVYQLTIVELPVCSGVTEFISGQPMHLDCLLAYSGPTKPALDWFRTAASGRRHHRETHSPELINSIDEYDIETSPVARKIVKNRAHPIDDRATYRCVVSVGELKKECHLKLSVEYHTQNLKISPQGSDVFVGDTVKCTAEGNPTPVVELQPHSGGSGNGLKSYVVTEEQVGEELEFSCTASNEVNKTTTTLSTQHTFRVSERPTHPPTTPAPTPAHHGHHDQVPHHSHPPKKDDSTENKKPHNMEGAQPVKVQQSTTGAASQTASALATLILSALVAYLVLN